MAETKKTTQTATDLVKTSKEFVTYTRTMAITMRDAAWAPWLTAIEKNDPIASMVRPWLDMTRTAHDKWLDLYENQAHTMIERSYGIMDTFRE